MLRTLIQQTFPSLTAYQADKKLRSHVEAVLDKIYKFEKKQLSSDNVDLQEQPNSTHNDDETRDAVESLDKFLKDEFERKKIIEEKARALLFIISATIAITTGSLTYLSNIRPENALIVISLALLAIGFVFLILAIISTLTALNISEYYYVLPSDRFVEDDDGYLDIFTNDKSLVEKLYRNRKLNMYINMRRGNHLYASFINIRNGVILIASFFILFLVSRVFLWDKPVQKNSRGTPAYNIVAPDSMKIDRDSVVMQLDSTKQ